MPTEYQLAIADAGIDPARCKAVATVLIEIAADSHSQADAAVSAAERAVDLTPEGHASKPRYLSNLGNHLSDRFRLRGDPADLDGDFMAVKVGDTIVFGQYAGSNTIDVDGEELIIMGEREIFAVVE